MSPPSFLTNWPAIDAYVPTRHNTYPFIDPSTAANLSGKSVLIAGASRGIGKAAAISFARAGCVRIAVAARSPLAGVVEAVKAAARGGADIQVLAIEMDVTDAESVAKAAEEVGVAFGGGLDVLVANAGYSEAWTGIAEQDPGEWWRSMEVNMKGVFLAARYFLPLLLESEAKLFVAVTSVGAHLLRPESASAYFCSKFAVCRFVELVQEEYGGRGVVAVGIHPGGVKTELGMQMPENMHAWLVDEPELFADGVVWLANERREWLAGRFINACWDFEELEKKKDDIVGRDLFKFRMTV